jgi:hypothetical protein
MATKNSTDASNAPVETIDTSDQALAELLNRVKASIDPDEIQELSDRIERVIFHKQFENA